MATLTNPAFPQTVSVQISGVPAGATLSAGVNNNGVWTLTAAQLGGVSITAPNTGIFPLAFTATAFDASNLAIGSASAIANVSVTANQPPVASNGSIIVTGTVPASGTLIATDAEGEALTFEIVANGGKGTAVITNAASGAFTYTAADNVSALDSFTFKASDANGASNVATISVSIVHQIVKPTAVIGSLNSDFVAPAIVSFDGSASAADLTAYNWNFGDGSSGTGVAPTHTYTAPGIYTVTLIVQNDAGPSDAAATTVTVFGATLSGQFEKKGSAALDYQLILPSGIPVGSTATLSIGTFTTTFTNVSPGKKIKSSDGMLTVTGSTLDFTLETNAAVLFGSPLPTSGLKIVKVTYNGHSFFETVKFTTKGSKTAFE
jgi:PKD repeat protein